VIVNDISQVRTSLRGVAEMLDADGYGLEVREVVGNRAVLAVSAGPQACAECLVPREILSELVGRQLREGGLSLSVDILYPAESHSAQEDDC
jgi:hypothetical protein